MLLRGLDNKVIMSKHLTYDLGSQKIGIVDTEFNNNNIIITRGISLNGMKLGTIAKE